MKSKPVPDQCKTCASLWRHGVKDGTHDRWCTKFGGAAPKVAGHCRQRNGYTARSL